MSFDKRFIRILTKRIPKSIASLGSPCSWLAALGNLPNHYRLSDIYVAVPYGKQWAAESEEVADTQ